MGVFKPNQQERIHLQYCKKIVAVKKCTQDDFVYGELGRVSLQTKLYFSNINYWFKILESSETRYSRFAYEMMLEDMEKKTNIVNWASNVKNLLYKFRKIIGKNDFPYHFKKIVVRYKKIDYNINVMRQTACLVVNPIKVNSFAYLFNCTTVGRTSD